MAKNRGGNSHQRALARAPQKRGAKSMDTSLLDGQPLGTPCTPRSGWERLLRILDNNIILTVVSILGGFLGFFVDGKLFLLFCFPIVLGIHRSNAISDLTFKKKVQIYAAVILLSMPCLWWIGIGMNEARLRNQIPTVSDMAAYVLSKIPPEGNSQKSTSAPQTPAQEQTNALLASSGLEDETANLARELVEFSDQRLGNQAALKNRLLAAALADAITGASNRLVLQRNLYNWNDGTNLQFHDFYWPQVEAMLQKLEVAGVDTSPVSRAIATTEPGLRARAVGLQLSVLAERIGEKAPLSRVVTPLEWQVILKESGGSTIQVYADMKDKNSIAVAKGLLRELRRLHRKFDSQIYPVKSAEPSRTGIWIFLPSVSSAEQSAIVPILRLCESEGDVTFWQVSMRPAEDPVVKIEIWPCDSTCSENYVLRHRGFN